MLSAIVASTGAVGTRIKPRVAAANVMLCASVNAVIVARSCRSLLTGQDQTQHEQEVVDTEQDVLNPEPDIGAQHHQRPRLLRYDEARIGWCQARGAHTAVAALNSHQHIGQRAVEPVDRDPLPF